MAPQKEFESPTFRLGGGRSILLSYWGVYTWVLYWKMERLSTEKGEKREKHVGKSAFPLYFHPDLEYNISAKESNETRVIPHEY